MSLVLVTGATGFIGAHCVKQLLERNYKVRGTVRDPNNTEKNQFLKNLKNSENLELVKGELTSEENWEKNMEGVTYVLHIASPFFATVKNVEKDLIEPAVMGTTYVLNAAKKSPTVKRVVLTSSMAAVSDCFDDWANHTYGPNDWNTTSSKTRNPYYYSKVLGEKKAWELVKDASFDLVVINPFVVTGPAVDPSCAINESHRYVVGLVSGEFPILPNLSFGLVDVRDVALAHILAMDNKEAGGKRFLLTNAITPISHFASIVKKNAPPPLAKKVATNKPVLPFLMDPLTKLFARITQDSGTADYLAHNIGKQPKFDTSYSTNILGLKYMDVDVTIAEGAKWVIDNKKYITKKKA